ncbi:MAG TPA: type I-E CRISPR-associated protein Cas7/Cse4/CasC, partial [Firmicutes bacterium]|nr:type I-E CRISPR-associated protein Cas7/Cse4/CasC [Bacillota bacterium]
AAAEVSPGAKLGATAPYARAECVVLEVGDKQPRSLANAFLHPVNGSQAASPMGLSVSALADYIAGMDQMYGAGEKRFVSLLPIHEWPRTEEAVIPLGTAIEESLKEIFGETR